MRDTDEASTAFDGEIHSAKDLTVGTGASIVVATAAMIALVVTVLIASFAPANAAVPVRDLQAHGQKIEIIKAGLTPGGQTVVTAAREGNFAISESQNGNKHSLASVLVWVVVLGASGALAAYTRDKLARRS